MSFRNQRLMQRESFEGVDTSALRLENGGELLVVPSNVSDEAHENGAELDKQIDGTIELIETAQFAEEDVATLEGIADKMDDEKEMSPEHADAVELAVESIANRWGCELTRSLGRESFGENRKEGVVLARESIGSLAKAIGMIAGFSVAYIGTLAALAVSIDWLVFKLTPYRKMVTELLKSLAVVDESDYQGRVAGFDAGIANSGWIAKLTLGDEYIGGDKAKLEALIAQLSEPAKAVAKFKSMEDIDASNIVAKAVEASKEVLEGVSDNMIPILGGKFIKVETADVAGGKVIVSATVVDAKATKSDVDALDKAGIASVLKSIGSLIDTYTDNKDLKDLSASLKALGKKAGKVKGEGDDAADVQAAVKCFSALTVIYQKGSVDGVKQVIEGIIGFSTASFATKMDKRAQVNVYR